jgi:hypothetical protein
MLSKKIMIASAFALAVGGAFASQTSASKPLTNVNRFQQTSNNCIAIVCSDTEKTQLCGASTGGDIFKVDGGTTCSTAETVYIYRAD